MMLALVFVLFKLGVFTALGQMFVAQSTQHFRDMGKAAEKPQTVVLNSGERIGLQDGERRELKETER
ncbi:MAG TPA: hypothetical protein VEK08_02175 [Planctomycetota bacterium]|nr:hypothetical protein [Planctomycetota bacterium]